MKWANTMRHRVDLTWQQQEKDVEATIETMERMLASVDKNICFTKAPYMSIWNLKN